MTGVFKSGKMSTGIRRTLTPAPRSKATTATITTNGCRSAKTMGFMLLVAQRLHLKLIEIRLSVRLRPQADLARVLDAVVLDLQVLLSVQVTLDLVALHFDLQRIPFTALDLHLLALKLLRPL